MSQDVPENESGAQPGHESGHEFGHGINQLNRHLEEGDDDGAVVTLDLPEALAGVAIQ